MVVDVNIVPSERREWIIGRAVDELGSRNSWTVGNYRAMADVNYFVSFYAAMRPVGVRARREHSMTAAFFTHPENPEFFSVARQVDIKVCMAEQYARALGGHLVPLGVDKVFQPRIRLGFVGRIYSSGRKGEGLLSQLDELDFVEVVRPEMGMSRRRPKNYLHGLAGFYSTLDALVVTSSVEGGPVPAAEAIACGVPVIAPEGVGNMGSFATYFYRKGSIESLTEVAKELMAAKVCRANKVADWSWDNFAQKNREIIEREFSTNRGTK